MKKVLINLALGFTFLLAKTFTVSDPPMVYIYHFVSYDTTSVLLHGGTSDESQNKKLKFPLFNRNDLSSGGDDVIIGKPLDPKLVSSMVTTAVSQNSFINIAGESIQNRIKTDNFIKLIKSYDYPKRTDYIFIGEINTVATQYEIDLKLMDVSTQKIVSSTSFSLPFSSMGDLRKNIYQQVVPVINWLVAPFTGNVFARVDSTSRDRVRWDEFYIRPLRTFVGSELVQTAETDFQKCIYGKIPPTSDYMKTHGEILKQYLPEDYVSVFGPGTNGVAASAFLAGEYRFRAYLKNNEDPFETNFTVKAGDLNEIHILLPYTPPPPDTDSDGIPDEDDACPDSPGEVSDDPQKNGCPPPPPPKLLGNIVFKNIWDGVGFELSKIGDEYDSLIMSGLKKNNEISLNTDYKFRLNKDKTTVTVLDLPMGIYTRNSFKMTEEKFPGKHYVNLFSDSDSLALEKPATTITSTIADQGKVSGREVVIYFDPFTPLENDEYILYQDENLVPFTKTSIAGELHIVGISPNYYGTLSVRRDGFKDAVINIGIGNKKTYHIADLNRPENEEESGKITKFFK